MEASGPGGNETGKDAETTQHCDGIECLPKAMTSRNCGHGSDTGVNKGITGVEAGLRGCDGGQGDA